MIRQLNLVVLVMAFLGPATSVAAADTGPAGGGPIMPLSQVQPGMNCTSETVIEGTTISSFDVQIIDVVQQAGEGPRILVSVSGPAVAQSGVAEGFSGSPVYCPDATGASENVGAISEGVGQYGNNVALVTPIQEMLGQPVDPPSSAPRLAARARPLLGPLTASGLSPSLLGVLERAGANAGRLVVPAPDAPFLGFPVQPLVAGASVAASYSSGAIGLGAIGTVTYRAGQTVYAFGHELDGAGRRSLLLQDAYVNGVIDNPDPSATQPSYKLASPGHTEGTLTSDTPDAVIGTVGPPPAQIPVDVTATDLDTGQALSVDSEVADETDVGFPLGSSLVDMVAPLAAAQAATQVYDGPPASESGRMCFEVSLRGQRLPLSFCNRYVGTGTAGDSAIAPPELATATSTDVTTALGLLDAVQFTQLHVAGVSARIYAQRGLVQGQIVSAIARRHVKPGQRLRVHLLVRLYRGGLRRFSFTIRVPRGLRGRVVALLNGPSASSLADSAGGLASQLSAALTGGSFAPSDSGPTSISDLRSQFAAVARYDGLQLSFARRSPSDVYRNASLVILGSARLTFIVGR